MCPKLTVLWITSLLFDLITNLLTGASLLALAKSIYYSEELFLLDHSQWLAFSSSI